jgi:hypothetical protein
MPTFYARSLFFADLAALIFTYFIQSSSELQLIALYAYTVKTLHNRQHAIFLVACIARHVCLCSDSQAKVKLESYMRFLFCPKDGSSRFLRIVVNFYQLTWCHYTSWKPTTHDITGFTYCMLYLFLVIQTSQIPRISRTSNIPDISLFRIFCAGSCLRNKL